MNKSFKMLVETQAQAEKLLREFDKMGAPALYKRTANGKYIVTFQISVK